MKPFMLFVAALFFVVSEINSQWIEQVSGVNVSLNSSTTFSVPGGGAYICGNSGTVLKTTNGGTNWLSVSAGIPAALDLKTIYAVSPIIVLTAGTNASGMALVYRTTNGGTTWQNTFSQQGCNIYGFAFVYNRPYIIGSPVGARWSIWYTTNDGLNWDSTGWYLPQAGSETGFYNSVFSLDEKFWFGTNNSHIYRSEYAAPNWKIQSTAPEVNSSAISFQFLLVDNIGIGLTGGTNILRTIDMGFNWLPVATPGAGSITGISFLPGSTSICWYLKGEKIYSGINGNNFSEQYTAPNGVYNHISYNITGYPGTWAVRNNGGISKYTGQIGIQQISTEIPDKFSLSQNYPNPFNPSTKIKFMIPLSRGVSVGRGVLSLVRVYDALGRETATLVNEQISPGTYEVEWNAGNNPSGIYFCRLVSGDYSKTIKMTMIK